MDKVIKRKRTEEDRFKDWYAKVPFEVLPFVIRQCGFQENQQFAHFGMYVAIMIIFQKNWVESEEGMRYHWLKEEIKRYSPRNTLLDKVLKCPYLFHIEPWEDKENDWKIYSTIDFENLDAHTLHMMFKDPKGRDFFDNLPPHIRKARMEKKYDPTDYLKVKKRPKTTPIEDASSVRSPQQAVSGEGVPADCGDLHPNININIEEKNNSLRLGWMDRRDIETPSSIHPDLNNYKNLDPDKPVNLQKFILNMPMDDKFVKAALKLPFENGWLIKQNWDIARHVFLQICMERYKFQKYDDPPTYNKIMWYFRSLMKNDKECFKFVNRIKAKIYGFDENPFIDNLKG